LLYGRRFYFYQSGFDPMYRQHSVGLLTMGLAIKHALTEGAEDYDLLHGKETYKFLWAKETAELDRLHLYHPGFGGAVCRRAVMLDELAKSAARRYLPPAVLEHAAAWRRGEMLRSSSC
jgi:CelD/BcsL family acetyltransferase involved in cellulose biosynthesis